MTEMFLQATASTTIDPYEKLLDFGAVGLLALFALLGLVATVVAYRRLAERFIRYLEEQAEKNSAERAAVTNVLTRLVEAVDRIERRSEIRSDREHADRLHAEDLLDQRRGA